MIYTVLWLAWLVWFLIEEGIALARGGPGATLSAHVWRWFGTDRNERHPQSGWTRIRRVALAGFMLWLAIHFMTGGWW